MSEANALLDESIPQIQVATELLRKVVSLEPDHLEGLHNLNWCLDSGRRFDPGTWEREVRDEHWAVRDRILALTKETQAGGPLSMPQRARALALSQWAEAQVMGTPTDAELDAIEAALVEAEALRPIPDLERGRRGAAAWREARRKDARGGYDAMLARLAEQPDMVVFDASAEEEGRSFHGLEGAFSDPDFLAWLEAQAPAMRPKNKKKRDAALVLAAGGDAHPFYGKGRRSGGRAGRVLGLRALGASMTSTDSSGRTLLHLAAMVDDATLLEVLMRLGASADAVDDQGQTALHLATEYDHLDSVRTLAKDGPVNALDTSGRTALFDARSADVARALLDAGADPNGGGGWTPLHQIARHPERGPVAEVLVARGAALTAKDRGGRTPLEEALEYNNVAVAKILKGASGTGDAAAAPPGLPLAALVDAARTREAELVGAWYFEDANLDGVRRVLEASQLAGDGTWDRVAARTQGIPPWEAMALVELARDALENGEQATGAHKSPRFVLGNLRVDGDLHLAAPLLVTGDLVVEGVLRNAGPEGALHVGGSVRADAVDSDGELRVAGTLEARVVWAHHNDPSLGVGKKLIAKVLIVEDQALQAELEVTHLHRGDPSRATEQIREVFVDAVFTGDGLDREQLFASMRRGTRVFR